MMPRSHKVLVRRLIATGRALRAGTQPVDRFGSNFNRPDADLVDAMCAMDVNIPDDRTARVALRAFAMMTKAEGR